MLFSTEWHSFWWFHQTKRVVCSLGCHAKRLGIQICSNHTCNRFIREEAPVSLYCDCSVEFHYINPCTSNDYRLFQQIYFAQFGLPAKLKLPAQVLKGTPWTVMNQYGLIKLGMRQQKPLALFTLNCTCGFIGLVSSLSSTSPSSSRLKKQPSSTDVIRQ